MRCACPWHGWCNQATNLGETNRKSPGTMISWEIIDLAALQSLLGIPRKWFARSSMRIRNSHCAGFRLLHAMHAKWPICHSRKACMQLCIVSSMYFPLLWLAVWRTCKLSVLALREHPTSHGGCCYTTPSQVALASLSRCTILWLLYSGAKVESSSHKLIRSSSNG